MAAYRSMPWSETGLAAGALYLLLREQTTGNIFQETTGTLVAEVAVDRPNYDVVLTETAAGSYTYQAEIPAALPPGRYIATGYQRLGGTAAAGDPAVWEWAPFIWDGDNEESPDAGLDTVIPELGVGAPPAQPSVREALMLLYMALRNGRNDNGSLDRIFNDAGTPVSESVVADNGTTFSRAKLRTPQ